MGVALISNGDAAPVGNADDHLLGPHRLPGAEASAIGNSRSETSRPSARRKVIFEKSSGDWSGLRRLSTILRASRLKDLGAPVTASKTTTPTGEVSISVSRSALADARRETGPALETTMRRLGGEHLEGLLVFGSELPSRFLHGQEEVAQALAPVQDREPPGPAGPSPPRPAATVEVRKAQRL